METEKYVIQKQKLPQTGKQLIGSAGKDNIIIYQAYNPVIAAYAVEHQQLGGSHYSLNRMSWIKPGFLWMMHRSGWASKENQEKILAITLPMIYLKKILHQATLSSYNSHLFSSEEEWKTQLHNTEVRLQWDPDHDPFGNKEKRKAVQIGMKGEVLSRFCSDWIVKIEDITDFVKKEYQKLQDHNVQSLNVPYENVVHLDDPVIEKRIGIDPNFSQ